MSESFQFSVDLPVSPERVYRAWLDGAEHSRFTGQPARVDARPGGTFSSLGGRVKGAFQVLTPFDRIVQTWQPDFFPAGGRESTVEIQLEPTCLGAQLVLIHTGIPDGYTRPAMEQWEKAYLRPLRDYFDALVGEGPVDIDG